MDSIVASPPLHSLPPFRFSSRPPFTAFLPIPNRKFISNSPKKSRNPTSLASISVTPLICFAAKTTSATSESAKEQDDNVSGLAVTFRKEDRSLSQCLAKQLVRALFCFAVGFSALGTFRVAPAYAIAAPWAFLGKRSSEKEKVKSHEYSDCTERLLETVSGLLRSIEEVRKGNGDMNEVEQALKAVKAKKEESQGEIMGRLYPELRKLTRDKGQLTKRAGEIVDEILNAKREYDKLKVKAVLNEEEKARMERLEQRVGELEQEYNGIWERVGDIEDMISRRETVALSYGVMEISFIERECEKLVERFKQEMKQKAIKSLATGSVTRLSKFVIQKDLETVQRKHLEQEILPSILDVEDLGSFFHQDSIDFAQRLKRSLKDSRERQRNLEAKIRKNLKKLGKEKHPIIYSPEEEERILLDRDRVVSRTWYNEDKNRWEMDPVAVPYAVSKRLIEHARIRHDWGAVYIALKGEDKEFYVDIKEFEMLFKDIGGFDGLYMKMLACGIPTAVQLMWIPFSELDIRQQFLVTLRVFHRFLRGLWNSGVVSNARNWIFKKIKDTTDDIMVVIVFPIVEFLIPYPVRIQLGMAWPEEIFETVDSTWYLKWQSDAEANFRSRQTNDEVQWFIWFLIRTVIYGFVLFHVLKFMRRRIPRLLGYGPLRKNPNKRKLRRVKYYIKQKLRKIKNKRKDGVDPIKTAFEQMKRVKKPPIPLKNFASIESMKEEINEVVAFLQNPRAFQEMGARAPRGVLIVGERGTGKTSLALAIAAEARVPLVEIKAQQLEAGLWVGQSASNVRELFQTARDLAPVIIFVEDFDLFAGVRGTYIHTKNQDHETFINQLLVELDGFEKQDGIVLMATTRNLKQIDEALQRPGRMDRIFHLQRPTQAEREKILYLAAKETMDDQLIDYVDWKKVAEKTALLRPIELKLVPVALEGSAFQSKVLDTDELMSYCGFFATFSYAIPPWLRKTKIVKKLSKVLVNHLGLTLTKEDLQNVVDLMEPYGQISNGIELLSPPLDWTRETKFPHAVWAAGRGLIALLLPNFDVVDNLWLEPLSWQGIGCTKITKSRNEGSINGNSESRSYLEKKLVFCFGSYVASQMLLPFGEENLLSSSEIRQAQEIATRMVIQYGWGPDDSPAIYYRTNAVTALSMGDDHEYVMAAKVEKMFDLAYLKAREMLQKNRRVLEKIVEELLEFEILTGKDLERITEDNGGIKEKEPFSLGEVQASEVYDYYL
ncbi:P-loop containing nucleoside triphosphate hydrolase [Sesbania bispinosa]|nr:P-loop containing nucleoside triphosphate hydrolase [Sesbania bispinosa]